MSQVISSSMQSSNCSFNGNGFYPIKILTMGRQNRRQHQLNLTLAHARSCREDSQEPVKDNQGNEEETSEQNRYSPSYFSPRTPTPPRDYYPPDIPSYEGEVNQNTQKSGLDSDDKDFMGLHSKDFDGYCLEFNVIDHIPQLHGDSIPIIWIYGKWDLIVKKSRVTLNGESIQCYCIGTIGNEKIFAHLFVPPALKALHWGYYLFREIFGVCLFEIAAQNVSGHCHLPLSFQILLNTTGFVMSLSEFNELFRKIQAKFLSFLTDTNDLDSSGDSEEIDENYVFDALCFLRKVQELLPDSRLNDLGLDQPVINAELRQKKSRNIARKMVKFSFEAFGQKSTDLKKLVDILDMFDIAKVTKARIDLALNAPPGKVLQHSLIHLADFEVDHIRVPFVDVETKTDVREKLDNLRKDDDPIELETYIGAWTDKWKVDLHELNDVNRRFLCSITKMNLYHQDKNRIIGNGTKEVHKSMLTGLKDFLECMKTGSFEGSLFKHRIDVLKSQFDALSRSLESGTGCFRMEFGLQIQNNLSLADINDLFVALHLRYFIPIEELMIDSLNAFELYDMRHNSLIEEIFSDVLRITEDFLDQENLLLGSRSPTSCEFYA